MLRSCLSSSKRELKCELSGFPRICVGLLRLCVGVKLVRESGSRLNMSRHELERELAGFPRIC
ncbi:hypothetical protein PIB30_104937, partial [Stylosanthes scabra]|nr:hypothetical protein [Stylosanthes scabra]